MNRMYVAAVDVTVLTFDSAEERDAYETHVVGNWTDRGYDPDSCLFWLY